MAGDSGGVGDPTGGGLPGGSTDPFATDPSSSQNSGWWNSFLGWLTGGNQSQQGGGGGGGVPLGGSSTAGKIGTGATALDTAKFIAQLIQSQHKGQFQNVPLSPQQQALFNFSFSRLAGSPNPSQDLYPYALQHAYTSPSFDINAAMQGKPAYSPGQPPDMSSLMAMINSNNSALNPGSTATTDPFAADTVDKPAGLAHSRLAGGAAK